MARKDLFLTSTIRVQEDEGFIILDETRAGAVAVLPFRNTPEGFEVLARYEPLPAQEFKYGLCCLTGGVDAEENPQQAAARELFEESGYRKDALIYLGMAYPSKVWARPMFLFAVDVTGLEAEDPPGDGSLLESLSTTVWVDLDEAHGVNDAPFLACLCRLKTVLT